MPEYKFIKLEDKGERVDIVLDKEGLNILDIVMMGEINNALDSLKGRDSLKVVVFRSIGKAFSAGVEVLDHTPEKAPDMIDTFHGMFIRLQRLGVASIAAVQGAALGGGMELAIFCDMIIASEKAKFGQPEVKLAFFPPIAAVVLPQLIGRPKAMEMMLTGNTIKADEALQLGLVSKVVAPDELDAATDALAESICSNSASVLKLNRKALDSSLHMPFGEALERVSSLFLNDLMALEDVKEGLASFAEKRPPKWKNK